MNPAFYSTLDAESRAASVSALSWMRDRHKFDSVVDYGCGVGTWIKAARESGARGPFLGLDGEWVPKALRVISDDEFHAIDFRKGFPSMDRFDLAICVEVAEHLPEHSGHSIVEALTRASDLVLWSAAVPRQGGDGHINEQWPSWWAEIFAARGYGADEGIRWELWRTPGLPFWYRQNVILYRKGAPIVRPLDAVHPAAWERARK